MYMLVCTYYQCDFCVKTSLNYVTSNFFFLLKSCSTFNFQDACAKNCSRILETLFWRYFVVLFMEIRRDGQEIKFPISCFYCN
jgi:hypothetical protein